MAGLFGKRHGGSDGTIQFVKLGTRPPRRVVGKVRRETPLSILSKRVVGNPRWYSSVRLHVFLFDVVLGRKRVLGYRPGHQAAQVAKDARGDRAVAVTTFHDTDDTPFGGRVGVHGEGNGVPGDSGIKVGGYLDRVPLHTTTLPLAGVESGREENGGFGGDVGLA